MLLTALLLTAAAPVPADTTALASEVEIREWTVPWADTRPRDRYVAPDGRVWLVGQRGHYVGVRADQGGGRRSRRASGRTR